MYLEKSKNPYWHKIKALTTGALTDSDTEKLKGQWRKKTNGKIVVEIGCNGGHVTLGRAEKNPHDFYIGLDWKPKQIYLAYEKAVKRNIHNTFFLRAKAERINSIFEAGEIDFLCIYFPDPWPKKKQLKHRYLTAQWFQSALPLLSSEGSIEIKTDHRNYFDFILEEVEKIKTDIKIIDLSFDLYKNYENPKLLTIPEVTLFEKLFIKDGLPIHHLHFKKIPSKENT